nr:hypothetical protein [Tanacetum cinerariifolium]
MIKEMGMDIDARLSMRHIDPKGLVVFTIYAWRRLFDVRGPLVRELMLDLFSTYRFDDLVAQGPERQQVAAADAPEVAEGVPHAKEEGDQVSLGEQHEVVDSMAIDLSRFIVWAARELTHIDTFYRILEIGVDGFLLSCTGPRWKEIDNIGEVSII